MLKRILMAPSADADLTVDPFRNPATRVRINPETYIRFDGSDHVMLQNILCDQGIRIQPDIMLILWDLMDWKSVGDLIAPWPPGDQEKIMTHLGSLHRGQIIIKEGDTAAEAGESGLTGRVGGRIQFNVENHQTMLRDAVRTLAYRQAIQRVVQPGMVAMDMGCGTGVLGFFAAQAGASKVYALERRSDVLMLAKALAEVNGLTPKMTFVDGTSTQIPATTFSPKPDILIAELLGNAILNENVLECTLDARDRFLKPGGRMLPWKLDLMAVAFEGPHPPDPMAEVGVFKELYGLDFSLLGQVLREKGDFRTDRYQPVAHPPLTEAGCLYSLDFQTMTDTVFHSRTVLPVIAAGEVTMLCLYFKAYLDDITTLSNSPWGPQTHWTHLLYALPQGIRVTPGQGLPVEVLYDGSLRVEVLSPEEVVAHSMDSTTA